MLIGTPPFFLMVTNAHENLRLQSEDGQPETRDGTPIYPSISRDGSVIAYARIKAGQPQRIVAISTYSATTDKHTDYSEGEYSGTVAISQDAARLAFSASRRRPEGSGDDHLHIVDLSTRQEIIGPQVPSFAAVFASWSPDSQRLAYSFDGEVRVWDANTGKVTKIADGDMPAWSPSGEWIAYLQGVSGRWEPKCFLVHPDGTSAKTLIELPHKKTLPRFLVEAPVWSPDSQTILLSELTEKDTGSVDIHLLDLKTLKLKTVFRDALRVLGWAEAK